MCVYVSTCAMACTKTFLDFCLCSPLFNFLPPAFQALFLYATTHTSHYSITDISIASGLRTYTTVPHSGRWWHSNEEHEQWHTNTQMPPRPILVHLCCTFSIPHSIHIAIPKYNWQDVYLFYLWAYMDKRFHFWALIFSFSFELYIILSLKPNLSLMVIHFKPVSSSLHNITPVITQMHLEKCDIVMEGWRGYRPQWDLWAVEVTVI